MYIPTVNDIEELKKVYREKYGETAYEYQHNEYELLEFRLLNDAYQEKLNNEGISLFMLNYLSIQEINSSIRHCLDTGIPYEYPDFPEDVVI